MSRLLIALVLRSGKLAGPTFHGNKDGRSLSRFINPTVTRLAVRVSYDPSRRERRCWSRPEVWEFKAASAALVTYSGTARKAGFRTGLPLIPSSAPRVHLSGDVPRILGVEDTTGVVTLLPMCVGVVWRF